MFKTHNFSLSRVLTPCRNSLITAFIVAADFADMGGKLSLHHLLSDKEMKWLKKKKKKDKKPKQKSCIWFTVTEWNVHQEEGLSWSLPTRKCNDHRHENQTQNRNPCFSLRQITHTHTHTHTHYRLQPLRPIMHLKWDVLHCKRNSALSKEAILLLPSGRLCSFSSSSPRHSSLNNLLDAM